MRMLRRTRAGFTLVEMIIVVAILAVMTTAGVPRLLARQDQWQVSSAARQLANDLRALANLSVAASQSYEIDFLLISDQYILPGTNDPSRPSLPYRVDLKKRFGVDIVSTSLPAVPAPSITFSGHGMPSSSITISLAKNAALASVTVAITGEVSITP
jgi:prepilin-type N-terminal cleavage/methylation domain-containing protein